jgi:TPR repeat protein
MLGFMYRNGRGVPKDAAQAVQWYRAAAEQNDAMAQFKLGLMCFHGEGVPKDNVQAVKWYRAAAEQGLVEAQNMLGVMYDLGRGVPKNDTQAAKWYRAAAEQGYIDSREYLKNLAKQPGLALTTLYEYAALNSDEKNIQLLLQKDPNQCYDLIRQDKYLKPETRANYLKFLVDEQLKNPTIKLDEAKLIAAGSEVASFRFSRLIKGDNQKPGRIKLTAEEIAYQSKLLRAVPEGHPDYADAQLILSYFEFKNDINGVAWRKHFLNAQKADPKRKENNEFPELPEDIRRYEVNLAARRLIGFWRDESLKNLNDNTGTTVELKDMKAKKGVKK